MLILYLCLVPISLIVHFHMTSGCITSNGDILNKDKSVFNDKFTILTN